jgi:hypothetical protein
MTTLRIAVACCRSKYMKTLTANRRLVWLAALFLLCGLGTIALVSAPIWGPHLITGVSLFAGTLGTVLMSPRDVGRLLNLSASRVIQLEKEGLLAAERDSSGRRFFRRSVVKKFAAERAARLTKASRNRKGRFASTSSPQPPGPPAA